MKKIFVSFPDEHITATAILLEEKAPSTCTCIWKALETPVEGMCIHAMWTGFRWGGYVRFVFANSEEDIVKGLDRIGSAVVSKLKG
jgi:hypothetical protein